ncbi:hypothetical protein QO010_004227 [Caulobacter ginsengisoli]|uniref:N-acetyltransferase domain-containing protein n=1 Tax=Caulobacter ginsengisoli TaxID=400775 RepID=A0ABU0IWQ0_9CAUL|nr:GNAT family N-acetyltransferase [Caulobacter ginsengisoli]MDQ0466434.1 hypothetical protein [Caulobacter ginsengisoli]
MTQATTADLEAIERDAWLDMFDAAPAPFATAAGLACRRFGEASGFAIRLAPTVQFNRVQGEGVAAAPDDRLDAMLTWLRESCGPVWALQVVAQAGEAVATSRLAERGLVPNGSWTKFVRPAGPAAAKTSLTILRIGADRAQDFGGMVQAGFGAPPPFAPWAAALAGRSRWTTYVAYDGETPVGAAAMFVDRGLAWLGLGCCLPSHRGRGAQPAMLAARIADAQALGARAVVTETGTPPPGEEEEHPSFRNIVRAGFEPVYRRINYRPS